MKFKTILQSIAGILCVSALAGCGGDDSPNPPNNTKSKVSVNISGVIYDDKGIAIPSAKIRILQSGVEIKNLDADSNGKLANIEIQAIKNQDVIVQISKNNYINQAKSLGKFTQNSTSNFNISLLKATFIATNIALNASGTVSDPSTKGASVSFDANSFVDINGNLATSANVSLAVLNPNTVSQSFPGNTQIVLSDGNPGYMASLGMVDFAFTQNDGSKLNLAPGKEATITIPLFGLYNDNAEPIKLGDTIPFWTMDNATGNWKEEGFGVVVSSSDSPTGLAVSGKVKHFSWWNLDFAINRVNKTVELYDKTCNTLYTGGASLSVTFNQAIPNSSKYGNGLTTVLSGGSIGLTGSEIFSFPVGFDANITGSFTNDNKFEVSPKAFTWAEISNTNVIKLCLRDIKPAIDLKPDTEFLLPIGSKYQFSYTTKGLVSADVKWYVDGIEGGNSSVGTIDSKGNYVTTGLSAAKHTIKIISNDDNTLTDEVIVDLANNLEVKNKVIYNGNDIFADTDNNYQKYLVKGYTNTFVPYLNGIEIPANSITLSLECINNQAKAAVSDNCEVNKYSIVGNQIIVAFDPKKTSASDFSYTEFDSNLYGEYVSIKAVLKSNTDIEFSTESRVDNLHNLFINSTNTDTDNLNQLTYSLKEANTEAIVKLDSPSGAISWQIYCFKDGTPCNPPSADSKRPRIVVRNGEKEIDILSPDSDFDTTEQYYLGGVFNDNIQSVYAILKTRVDCYSEFSNTRVVCRPNTYNESLLSQIESKLTKNT